MEGLQHYVSQSTNALLETKLIKYEKLLQTVPERSIPIEVAVGDWYNGWIEGISVHPNFMGLCIRNTTIYWFCSGSVRYRHGRCKSHLSAPVQHSRCTPSECGQGIDWLVSKGYIVPSSSPWASPMVTVRKADGSARLCVDFRKINSLTRQTPFYMPRVEEVLEGVGQASFISKLDLSKGYYQVQLTEEAMPKTAFMSHRGTYQFTRMPFGVKNAPACFQELMQRVLAEHRSYATAYMDDVVVYSTTWEDHLVHVGGVLQALSSAGLTANPTKCRWGGRAVEFLGHWVGAGTMSVPMHKTEALAKYVKPQTKRGLRAFIGSISFYRRYIESLASETAILTPMTTKQAPQRIGWTAEGECAFSNICSFFCSPPVLCIPVDSDVLSIVTDASGRGIGGVLQVQRVEAWQPAAYYSRQLRGAEHRYSATELEALALVETIQHFGYYLYGR